MILSRIAYSAPLWAGATSRTLKRLNQFMNVNVRWISGIKKGQRIETKPLYGKVGWLSLRQLIPFQCIKFVHKTIVTNSSKYFQKIFGRDNRTRIRPPVKCMERGFRWNTKKWLDNVPQSILFITSPVARYKKLKDWIVRNINDEIT